MLRCCFILLLRRPVPDSQLLYFFNTPSRNHLISEPSSTNNLCTGPDCDSRLCALFASLGMGILIAASPLRRKFVKWDHCLFAAVVSSGCIHRWCRKCDTSSGYRLWRAWSWRTVCSGGCCVARRPFDRNEQRSETQYRRCCRASRGGFALRTYPRCAFLTV